MLVLGYPGGGGRAGPVLSGQDQDVGIVGVVDDLEGDVFGGLAAAPRESVLHGVANLQPGISPRRRW